MAVASPEKRMMTEYLDAWGHKIRVNTLEEVGSCESCGGVMYAHESQKCENRGCERMIHSSCVEHCETCGESGCKLCLLFDNVTGHFFSDTSGPEDYLKTVNERLGISECYIKFKENDNEP